MKTPNLDHYNFKSAQLLKGMSDKDRGMLTGSMVFQKLKKGKSVFIETSYPSGIFYLKAGRIKEYKIDKDGKEQIFYICITGELFGCAALLSNEPYTNSATAIEDTEIGYIPRKQFFELLDNSKGFTRGLLNNLSAQFNAMVNLVSICSHASGRTRLAVTLLILNEKYHDGKEAPTGSVINLGREDMANMVGVAIETLVRLLNDFKEEGLITTNGRKISILNPRKVAEIGKLVM